MTTLYSRNSHYEPNPFYMLIALLSIISLGIALGDKTMPNREIIVAITVILTPFALVISYATGQRIYHNNRNNRQS